jgi:branched-chain amino acid transport system permease protein
VTALIGPNGAGKSTLFGLFTGFLSPDGGTVELHGVNVVGRNPNTVARMGMVRSFQDVRLFRRLSVLQNVMMAVPGQPGERMLNLYLRPLAATRGERHTRELAMEHLASVGMEDKAGLLAGDLGHGEQKLVAIARVLATGADVLLLDEPTSGVDPVWVDRVAQTVNDLARMGKTVCVVEHNLGFLQKLEAGCYFLESGRVVTHGRLADLMADEGLRKAYFGV